MIPQKQELPPAKEAALQTGRADEFKSEPTNSLGHCDKVVLVELHGEGGLTDARVIETWRQGRQQ